MANRYPLILDTEDGNKIKELPQGDSLYLLGNTIEEVGNINSVGIVNAAELRVNNQVVGPTAFTQLTDTPETYSNQNNKIVKVNDTGTGLDFVSAQDLGALSGGSISIDGNIYPNINGNGEVGLANRKWNTVRAIDLQGNLLDINGSLIFNASTSKINPYAISDINISVLNNDANYLIAEDLKNTTGLEIKSNILSSDDEVLLNNTTRVLFGDVSGNMYGNVYSNDSTLLVDAEQSGHYGLFYGDLTGSIFSDNSTALVDGVNGEIVGPIRDLSVLGETGNIPSDTGTVDSWLEITVNGNTRYIPLYA